jgi:crotonobetainyl-CoA:carnitine CoA-transferase CaiB-like acyl-CoA transferase
VDRRAARDEIVAKIQSVLSTRPRDEWLRRFVEAKVPAGPVNRVDQVTSDPELIARGLFYTDRANGRRIPQVGIGIGVDGSSASYRLPPPRLGEHTDEVLRGLLGYEETALAKLRNEKII